MPLLLIKDNYNRISILGKIEEEKPDKSWLAMQNKPFSEDAIFHTAYPLSGGAALVDIKNIEVVREVTMKDISLSAINPNSFNPASETILKLWNSPPDLPEFLLEKIPS